MDSATETPSIFLKKTEVGGAVKKGDILSLTVLDIDPETGDIEASVSPQAAPEPDGIEQAFDEAVPDDESAESGGYA